MEIIITAGSDSGELKITREEWESIGKERGWDKELLDGGRGDGLEVSDLAEMHGVPEGHIEEQLDMGMEVEREHSENPEIRKEISTDHIAESDEYYTDLAEMEKKFKSKSKSHS